MLLFTSQTFQQNAWHELSDTIRLSCLKDHQKSHWTIPQSKLDQQQKKVRSQQEFCIFSWCNLQTKKAHKRTSAVSRKNTEEDEVVQEARKHWRHRARSHRRNGAVRSLQKKKKKTKGKSFCTCGSFRSGLHAEKKEKFNGTSKQVMIRPSSLQWLKGRTQNLFFFWWHAEWHVGRI